MRRLGAILAFAVAALAVPTGAAEITHVATSGEKTNPFDLDLSVRWDREQQRGQIRRERAGAFGGVGDDMRYVRTRNAIVPRIAVGLYKDLELHAEMPYVLSDDRALRYAVVDGLPTGGVPPFDRSSIETNAIDAEGQACGTPPCPLFRVPDTIYHGGRAGDLEVGLAWGIFNDRKDDTKPFWLVGVDVTFPTATRWDPAKDRDPADWSSPNDDPAKPAAFGERVWKFDVHTALSRRLGILDPYFKAHATAMLKSSSTYSNCDHAAEMTAAIPLQMTRAGAANCDAFGRDAGAKLPWIAGVTFGSEIVAFENRREQQKVSVDVRGFADYTSSQRFYNELTDYTGKLHMTEGYVTMGGLVGVYLHASRYVSLTGTASLATRSAHRLTGESLGKDGAWPALNPAAPGTPGSGETADRSLMNPNFDWRYDAPGRRFRIAEESIFALSFAAVLQF